MQERLCLAEGAISTIFFDMDNTLFDLVGAKLSACESVVQETGEGTRDDLFRYFLEGHWGFEDFRNIRDYLEDRNCYTEITYEKCCRIYDAVKMDGIVPYPGVPETLAELKRRGFRLGIISDAFSREAQRRLDKTCLRQDFDLIVTCDVTGRKKPSPEPFRYALHHLAAEPSEVILVGDSPNRDMEPAQKLGMKTVYARYGDRFSEKRISTHADFIIDSMRELLPLVPDRFVSHRKVSSGSSTRRI
ncbi:MAG: HAD-IIIA family hydrolase [Methanoregulaceae archaeon]